jgi:hypothetical protein
MTPSAHGQDSPPKTRKGNFMRRKRFQRGSLKSRKRRSYWYGQWREDGECRSKEFGLCCQMSKGEAEAALAAILQPINVDAGLRTRPTYTFLRFIEEIYLPVCRGKWKISTGMTEESRLQGHLVGSLRQRGSPLARQPSVKPHQVLVWRESDLSHLLNELCHSTKAG